MMVSEELETIRGKHNGTLRPSDVVNFATDPSTELHEHFEWDDAKAGMTHRLNQARLIIRSVIIDTPKTEMKRAYINVIKSGESVYLPTVTVLNDSEFRKQEVATGFIELRKWAAKYHDLPEFEYIIERLGDAV